MYILKKISTVVSTALQVFILLSAEQDFLIDFDNATFCGVVFKMAFATDYHVCFTRLTSDCRTALLIVPVPANDLL